MKWIVEIVIKNQVKQVEFNTWKERSEWLRKKMAKLRLCKWSLSDTLKAPQGEV